jgi:hypothetical protein
VQASALNPVIDAWADGEAAALLSWAMWAADAVCYLTNLDDLQFSSRPAINGYLPDMLDIHHVRWAAGTAIMALDLCAAVLGRRYCSAGGSGHEFDLGSFDPPPVTTGKATKPQNRFGQLPQAGQAWVRDVHADSGYQMTLDARTLLVHRRAIRTLSVGAVAPRTAFRIGPQLQEVPARDLIDTARRVAVTHVERFLAGVMAKQL